MGYKISPLLWAKVKRGLSAGRVQSVALRIICDREEEIEAFIPQEYYTLDVILDNLDTKKQLVAKFYGDKNGKLDIGDKASLDKIMDELQSATYQVDHIKTGKREKKAPLPFTTSTLQQEASKALNFSIQKTMRIACLLYTSLAYYRRGCHKYIIHPETAALLEKLLVMLAEKGEEETFSYVRREVLHNV